MAQDLRDTAFFRRYRRIAGWACYVIFGLSALFGVVSLAGLVAHGQSLQSSELSGPLSIFLLSVAGGLCLVGARRFQRRQDAERDARRLEVDTSRVR
jgi:hypothetical protein